MAVQYPEQGAKAAIDASMPSDLALLERVQAGEEAAFGVLMDRHAPRLHRIAYSLLGNEADADDVLQETFLGALKGVKGFRVKASVKTWFTRILINQVARHRRYWRVRSNMKQMGDEAENILSGGTGQAKSGSDNAEIRLDIAEMLLTLSPEHRAVVALREMDGLSYEEIAEILNVPVGTVESRLFRARQELRGRLKAYLEDE
jgi:RNA polymerase sigma-70 factor (ECF subfamily)